MRSFDELFDEAAWRPIPGCPGRFTLVTPRPDVSPGTLAGAGARTIELTSPRCRDPIALVPIAGGGLLSYRRQDGSYRHTLNTTEGLARKLADLGLDAALAESAPQPPAGSAGRGARGEVWSDEMTTAGTDATDMILALLDRERRAFLAEVDRVPAARRGERPSPDVWSVVDVIEHVWRVDIGVTRILALRTREPVAASAEELAAAQLTPEKIGWVRGRAERVTAPDRVQPTATLSFDEALAQLTSARDALVAAYRGADAALLDGAIFPHPFVGPLTVRGWFELTAHHEARHARQIAELAERLGASPPEARAPER